VKVELHLHTNRYSACAVASPRELMKCLLDCGYEAVYLTEHDMVWPDEEIAELAGQFPQLRIFPGIELSIGELLSFQHLLVLGTNDREYVKMAHGARPDVEGILAKARAAGHLTVLAHPCRWDEGSKMLRRGFVPDALENRTCNQGPDQAAAARRLAEEHSLPFVNSGDVHSAAMVGRFWIDTAAPLADANDIRAVVLDGAYANCVEPET